MKKGDGIVSYDAEQGENHPPYPGVIIEEMIDSASQVGAPDDHKSLGKGDHYEVSS